MKYFKFISLLSLLSLLMVSCEVLEELEEPEPFNGWAVGNLIVEGIGDNQKLRIASDISTPGLYFRYGSLVGIATGRADAIFENSGDIMYSPSDLDIKKWADIIYLKGNIAITHTFEEVLEGRGDPCRLVGIRKGDIKETNFDNGKWRLPTVADFADFTTANGTPSDPFSLWSFKNGIALYASGYRDALDGKVVDRGVEGLYMVNRSDVGDVISNNSLMLNVGQVENDYMVDNATGFVVRCVVQ